MAVKIFKGVKKISTERYKELKDANLLDTQYLYITPSADGSDLLSSDTIIVNVTDDGTSLMLDADIVADIQRSLKLPMATPAATELVAIDNTKSQINITIGDGLLLEDGVLSATGGVDTSNLITTEEFNKLLNNETQLGSNANNTIFIGSTQSDQGHSNSVVIGRLADGGSSTSNNTVVIGYDAEVFNGSGVAIGYKAYNYAWGVSIGHNAYGGYSGGIAIGEDSKISGGVGIAIGSAAITTKKAIQLGSGTNNTELSLQVWDDNIYKADTHTLTVQNIELNGVNLATTLTALSGQNEYIGSYTDTTYTADTIQTVLTEFVQTTESRTPRGGDIVNIVGGIYAGQQWIYAAEDATWKYYIDFDNHSVINNLTSTSTTDGLSAAQGKVLNDTITNILNNTTKLQFSNGNFYLGATPGYTPSGVICISQTASGYKSDGSVTIGRNAQNKGASSAIAIGGSASVGDNSSGSIAIGGSANVSGGSGDLARHNAIQLGSGTNSTSYTLQIYDDNIYNHQTHTLTVQNIELNGVDLGTQLGDLSTALETILGV